MGVTASDEVSIAVAVFSCVSIAFMGIASPRWRGEGAADVETAFTMLVRDRTVNEASKRSARVTHVFIAGTTCAGVAS